ncbi:MAG: HAD-IA family hydrolase [Candidatus Dojkabacteria bacterium]|nr:MAG: HAD-IA family hydrolase [Candidatus Dojkabacteria bacterium]
MLKYKAVLFDLDDTLTKSGKIYDRALRFASNFLARKYSLDTDEFYSLVAEKHLIVQRNFPTVHTRHSRILVFRMALDEMVGKYDLSLLPDVEDMYWEFFMNNIELFPNVEYVLMRIRDTGMKVAIVSDGSLSLRIRKVKAAGLLHYVDQIIASEEVIFEKPFSAIFTLALSRLKIEPNEAVMIGNNYKNDIRGAQLIGIRAGIYDPATDGNVEGKDAGVQADFTIKDYPELLTELGIASK